MSLAAQREPPVAPPVFRWTCRPMGARVDLRDKDALLDALDEQDA